MNIPKRLSPEREAEIRNSRPGEMVGSGVTQDLLAEIDALRAELAAPPKAFAVKIQGADHPSDDGRDLDQYGVELRVS